MVDAILVDGVTGSSRAFTVVEMWTRMYAPLARTWRTSKQHHYYYYYYKYSSSTTPFVFFVSCWVIRVDPSRRNVFNGTAMLRSQGGHAVRVCVDASHLLSTWDLSSTLDWVADPGSQTVIGTVVVVSPSPAHALEVFLALGSVLPSIVVFHRNVLQL